jgi:uncharacterized protein YutE (UPF0331/DUF86 family)
VVDPLRLRSLLDRLGEELEGIADLLDQVDEPHRLPALKYRLVVAIEAAVDAAQHVVASERLRAPVGYADAIRVLAEAALLDAELADHVAKAAGLRNLLVHRYAEVDDARLVEELGEGLEYLAEYRRALARLTV